MINRNPWVAPIQEWSRNCLAFTRN